ncbi:MAG TPA: DUF1420 family protein [Candidatus Acidoferrales bacterium]|jgi:hypothetical protein|nr:DUF1420 family protein [Candidatus Acidoferrales bacterium]
MALIHFCLVLLAASLFLLAQLCLGTWILRKLHLEFESFPEHCLIAACSGTVLTEIAMFLIQWTQHIREGSFFVLFLSCLPIASEVSNLRLRARQFWKNFQPLVPVERFIICLIVATLLIEFTAALAPLTGSDALHYHFTVQKLILQYGFHPIFSITRSFLCGQSHLLILLGLALGGESLAMSFLFLGGALAALSVACLATRWVPRLYALAFALLFLLTPLVFWQISSSGAPDIWMAAFVSACVLVITQVHVAASWRHALLAGILAGGAAGAKYTGCLIAVALGLAFLFEYRSVRRTSVFFLAATFAGIWPYLRNLLWTGDPFFPMLTSRFFPERLNPYGLANMMADAGTAASHSPVQLLPFLFYFGKRAGAAPGFWDFYGPVVFALAPLVLLAWRNTRAWRVSTVAWFCAGLGIFLTSGLARFLLPIFPIALSCASAGTFHARQKGWIPVHRLASACILFACVLGAAGLPIYTAPAIRAALGAQSGEAYLSARAPDYQISQAVNQSLASGSSPVKALVFFRHLYYLRVRYVAGDPGPSWQVNPDNLKTAAAWRVFLHNEGITHVVRAPDYPPVLAAGLEQLEKEGGLVRFSETEVENFTGMRQEGQRVRLPVVIMKVNSSAEVSSPAAAP